MSLPGLYPQPFVRQDGRDYERIAWLHGQEVAVVLDSELTAGQFSLLDAHTRRGDASPVHVHRRDDEAFFLLDGAMTAWIGDERYEIQPGGICFLPRNIPHAVRFDVASRVLLLNMPAGPQLDIFRALGWDLSEPLPEGWQLPVEAVREAALRSGVEVVGPPHRPDD